MSSLFVEGRQRGCSLRATNSPLNTTWNVTIN